MSSTGIKFNSPRISSSQSTQEANASIKQSLDEGKTALEKAGIDNVFNAEGSLNLDAFTPENVSALENRGFPAQALIDAHQGKPISESDMQKLQDGGMDRADIDKIVADGELSFKETIGMADKFQSARANFGQLGRRYDRLGSLQKSQEAYRKMDSLPTKGGVQKGLEEFMSGQLQAARMGGPARKKPAAPQRPGANIQAVFEEQKALDNQAIGRFKQAATGTPSVKAALNEDLGKLEQGLKLNSSVDKDGKPSSIRQKYRGAIDAYTNELNNAPSGALTSKTQFKDWQKGVHKKIADEHGINLAGPSAEQRAEWAASAERNGMQDELNSARQELDAIHQRATKYAKDIYDGKDPLGVTRQAYLSYMKTGPEAAKARELEGRIKELERKLD